MMMQFSNNSDLYQNNLFQNVKTNQFKTKWTLIILEFIKSYKMHRLVINLHTGWIKKALKV